MASETVRKINLQEKAGQFTDLWNPRVVAELNGQEVMIVKFKGEIAGTIIYECKKCPGIKPEHIRQTALADLRRV